MMKDVRLLGERVKKLQTHFGQANEDLGNILISAGRSRSAPRRSRSWSSTATRHAAGNLIAGTVRKIEAAE